MATPQEEQGLLSAFGSMMQDFFTGSIPPFVRNMSRGIPGEVDPVLLQRGEDARNGRLPLMPDATTTLAAPTPSVGMGTPSPKLQEADNPMMQALVDAPLRRDEAAEEATAKSLAEIMGEEWERSVYSGKVVPKGEMDWEKQYGDDSHHLQFESQIRANAPEGADANAIYKRAKPGYLHSKGSYFFSNIMHPEGMLSSAVPTYFGFMEGGQSIMPVNTDREWDLLASASKHKNSDSESEDFVDWKRWKVLNPELTSGVNDTVLQQIFNLVKKDEDELAIIAAREGITGQGELGKRALDSLYEFKRRVDTESVRTQKPTIEGYISKWRSEKREPKPFSPLVPSNGFSRVRLGGPGVEASGITGQRSII